jgi:hypothetical protein
MCSITAVAVIGGGIMSAASSIYQGRQAKMLGNRNARILEQRAKSARDKGKIDKGRMETQQRLLRGRQIVSKSRNVQMGGSFLDALAFQAGQDDLDLSILDYNTELNAVGFENDANTQRLKGKVKQTASVFNATNSLFDMVAKGDELAIFG